MDYKDVSVELTYNAGQKDSFTLLVEGEYYAGTMDTYYDKGDDPEFNLQKVELIDGDLIDLLTMNLTLDAIVNKVYDRLG